MLLRIPLAFALILLGCGSDPAEKHHNPGGETQSLTCDSLDFEPCGGDVVGTWNLSEYCGEGVHVEQPLFGPDEADCLDSVLTVDVEVDMTLTFGADMSFIRDTSGALTMHANVTPSCGTAVAPTATIGQLCAAIKQQLDDDPDSPFQHVTCAATTGECLCDGDGASDDVADGTYETDDGELTFVEEQDTSDYCVDGPNFVMMPPAEDGDVYLIFD